MTRSTSAEAAFPSILAGACERLDTLARLRERLAGSQHTPRAGARLTGEEWITAAPWATLAAVVSLPREMLCHVPWVLPFTSQRVPAAGGGRPPGLPAPHPRADHGITAHPRLPLQPHWHHDRRAA